MKKSEVYQFSFSGSHDYTPITREEHEYSISHASAMANIIVQMLGGSSEKTNEPIIYSDPPDGNTVVFFVMSPSNCTIE